MKITIRGPVFETNSSSEHTFMYLSKETFEKWRRGEVMIDGGGYPVCDLTDDDFVVTEEKPDTVFDPIGECPEEKEYRESLNEMDDSVIKEDVLHLMCRHFNDEEDYISNDENWDGSYISMLSIFFRHHGECVSRRDANKRYVDPEDWGPEFDEVLAAFRKALSDIEKWKGFNDEKYSEFRKIVDGLRDKKNMTEETIREDLSDLWSIMFFDMEKHRIKDKEFKAFEEAFKNLYNLDCVYQEPYIELVEKEGKVRIHIWGRDDG